MNQPQQPAQPPATAQRADGPGAYRDTEQDNLVRSNDTVHAGMSQEEKTALDEEEAKQLAKFKQEK